VVLNHIASRIYEYNGPFLFDMGDHRKYSLRLVHSSPIRDRIMTNGPEQSGATSDKPEILTVEEWAEKMRISRGSAYNAVKNGEVQGVVRIGKLIRIRNDAA
jgi:excisionase family DNA binding protein